MKHEILIERYTLISPLGRADLVWSRNWVLSDGSYLLLNAQRSSDWAAFRAPMCSWMSDTMRQLMVQHGRPIRLFVNHPLGEVTHAPGGIFSREATTEHMLRSIEESGIAEHCRGQEQA